MKFAIAMSVLGLTCVAQTKAPNKGTSSAPKQASVAARKPGVVSGRVFAITAGGDIKPARLAKVYLIYSSIEMLTAWYDGLSTYRNQYLIQLKDPQGFTKAPLDKDNEDASFLGELAPAERDRLVALYKGDIDAHLALVSEVSDIKRSLVETAAKDHFERWSWTDELMCRRDLVNYDEALIAVRQWRWEHKEWDQFVSAQADEEGQFKITVPRSGKYRLFARGRAGFNEAFWSSGSDDVIVAAGTDTVVKLGQPMKSCVVLR